MKYYYGLQGDGYKIEYIRETELYETTPFLCEASDYDVVAGYSEKNINKYIILRSDSYYLSFIYNNELKIRNVILKKTSKEGISISYKHNLLEESIENPDSYNYYKFDKKGFIINAWCCEGNEKIKTLKNTNLSEMIFNYIKNCLPNDYEFISNLFIKDAIPIPYTKKFINLFDKKKNKNGVNTNKIMNK